MPFETVALDFIVKLPVSQGFDSILTITNQGCTKAAIFIPCNEDITAEETAALYIKHVFAHFRNGHTLHYGRKTEELGSLSPNSTICS
jgi:hypothetical protein